MKKCVLCDFPRRDDSKYCPRHHNDALRELRSSKYLTHVPGRGYRPPDAREKVADTKFGRPE